MIQPTLFGSYEVYEIVDGEAVVLFEGTLKECKEVNNGNGESNM